MSTVPVSEAITPQCLFGSYSRSLQGRNFFLADVAELSGTLANGRFNESADAALSDDCKQQLDDDPVNVVFVKATTVNKKN